LVLLKLASRAASGGGEASTAYRADLEWRIGPCFRLYLYSKRTVNPLYDFLKFYSKRVEVFYKSGLYK
jgi:hypothetical protein